MDHLRVSAELLEFNDFSLWLFWPLDQFPSKRTRGRAAPWPAAETFEGRGDRKKILKPRSPRQHRANRARGRRNAIRSLVPKSEEIRDGMRAERADRAREYP